MIRDMIAYFSPMLELASKSFVYKGGVLIPFAAAGSVGVEVLTQYLELDFLGVSVSLLVLISIMFIADFVTGIMATSKEYKNAIKNKNVEEERDKKFKSSKITFTFFKFIMLFLWIWLIHDISHAIEDLEFMTQAYNVVTTIPLILITLREYISIGENIERKYGRKPYMFTLVEKIFDILEFKFLKKIKDD